MRQEETCNFTRQTAISRHPCSYQSHSHSRQRSKRSSKSPDRQMIKDQTPSERLLVISPELADVLSAIISRIRGARDSVPLVVAYDDNERQ